MTSFTLTDVGNKSGAVVEAAFRGAVDITKCGKRKFVLLTAEQFDRLAGGTAQRVEDLMAPERNMIRAGLDAVTQDEGRDERAAVRGKRP